jgi:chromate reductase, NAD(P)H dehydrogenase (quinone)
MSDAFDIVVLIGSLRRESFTRKTVRALMEVAPASLAFREVAIGGLPHYNQDDEADPPQSWRDFRVAVTPADALLFATPEYNRSVSGVLKNAIDVGSRPPARNVWSGKPAAVISVTTGALGAFGANHQLRQSLVYVNVATMPQPEAYIAQARGLFDDTGRLINDQTRDFLARFAGAFASWIDHFRRPGAASWLA